MTAGLSRPELSPQQEKAIRIEAFGVECSVMARDLSWDWIGDARDRFSVGDQVLVRVLSVNPGGY